MRRLQMLTLLPMPAGAQPTPTHMSAKAAASLLTTATAGGALTAVQEHHNNEGAHLQSRSGPGVAPSSQLVWYADGACRARGEGERLQTQMKYHCAKAKLTMADYVVSNFRLQ